MAQKPTGKCSTKQIPIQPIFRYLQYPGSPKNVVVDLMAKDAKDSNIHEVLEPMRGQITRPTFITSAFWKYMVKAIPSFEGLMMDILAENNGRCGCLTTHDYANFKLEDNLRGQLSAVWLIDDDNIYTFMFLSTSGVSFLIGYMLRQGNNFVCQLSDSFAGYEEAQKEMNHALQCFTAAVLILLCLEKYAEVQVKELKPGKGCKVREDGEEVEYRPLGNQAFDIMDCRWFTEICSDKDFSVTGHFRWQPYKDEQGQWQRKLIYIDTFVKHGYHRKATIDKIRENINNNVV